MKHILFFEILKKLKSQPHLMRKVKIFAMVGLVGFLIVGSLTIWVGIMAINYMASSANQVIQSPIAQGHVQKIKAELMGLPQIQPTNCWMKAQSLLAIQPWLERPAIDNLIKLKIACLEPNSQFCEGGSCEKMKDLINTAEGRTI